MANIWKKTRSKAGAVNTAKPFKAPVKPTMPAGFNTLGGKGPGNPMAPINFDQYKTTSASVEDISKKYGIDFSREYAKRQAEAAAQAKRNAVTNQQKQVDTGVRNAQDALGRDYFNAGLQQAQAGVNGGINAGLQNEANLRLGMNRQAEMADIFRQSALKKDELSQELKTIETERSAQEEATYQQRLQMAADMINQNRSLDQNEKQMLLQSLLQQRGQNIDMEQFSKQLDWDKYQFNNMSASDLQRLNWDKYQFNNMSATDKNRLSWDKYQFNNMSAAEQAGLDWDKYMFNNMSAYQQAGLDWDKYQFNNMSAADRDASKLAWSQLEEDKKRFKTEQAWREHQFNNMSAAEKEQFRQDEAMFGKEMAWKREEMKLTAEMQTAIAEAEAGMSGSYGSGDYGGEYGGYLNFLP